MVLLKTALSRITTFIATFGSTMLHRGSLRTAVKSEDPSCLIPHLSPVSPEDDMLRALNKNIPVSMQHYARDKGIMRALADNSAMMAAASLGASNPSLLYRFVDAGKCMKNFKYGDIEGQNCQVFTYPETVPETATTAATAASTAAGSAATKAPASVLILVHGGAWGSGKPWMYRLMAAGMAKSLNARAAIVLQYPLYPECVISQQADSIYEALRFIRWNEKKLGLPDGATYVLSGHSSGANICALALLKAVENKESPVDCFIGLSGVYNIEKHYPYEKSRGGHDFSPMSVAAISPDRWWESSPTLLMPRMSREKVAACWPDTLLLHGVSDSTVPFSSSQEFAEQLLHQGAPVTTSYPSLSGHADCIFEFTTTDTTNSAQGPLAAVVSQYYSVFNSTKNTKNLAKQNNTDPNGTLQKLTITSKL